MPTKDARQVSDSRQISEIYERRVHEYANKQLRHDRNSNRLSNLRLIAFLAAAGCLLWGWLGEAARVPLFIAAGILLATFVVFVVLHRRALAAKRRAAAFQRLNEHGMARVGRNWVKIPAVDVSANVFQRAIARDLDLFGSASLYQLTCQARTPLGKKRLADWLLAPALPAAIRRRQEAVAELTPRLDWRHEMAYSGQPEREALPPVEPFLDWTEGEGWLASRRWLLWTSRTLPVLLIVLLALDLSGVLRQSFWLTIPLANIAITMLYARQVHGIFARVSSREGEIERYAQLLKLTASGDFVAPELQRIVRDLETDGYKAHHQIHRLRRLMDTADLRFSQLYLPVQALTLWDFHVLTAVERWQREVGRHVRGWFEALAEIEALVSLAALAHDNPGWTFPQVHEGAPLVFRARDLAHPLLPPETPVANDVEVGPPGSFLLVTGSNMSGKSTLLRAVATNAILAQAGATVCASDLSMPAMVVETSMRVQDSLESGISFFMAELNRLKEIVDAVRQAEQHDNRIFLYLLDEILQGTNSVERQIAVRRVMEHLLSHRAIGVISTHDLSLADAPNLTEAARTVHFRETIDAEAPQQMSFDYKLRPGLATTTNALRLLKIVGLDSETTEE